MSIGSGNRIVVGREGGDEASASSPCVLQFLPSTTNNKNIFIRENHAKVESRWLSRIKSHMRGDVAFKSHMVGDVAFNHHAINAPRRAETNNRCLYGVVVTSHVSTESSTTWRPPFAAMSVRMTTAAC